MYATIRRKRWESRMQAVDIVNAFGESMGGKVEPKFVPADSLMRKYGIEFE
jgi:hypothetical protein